MISLPQMTYPEIDGTFPIKYSLFRFWLRDCNFKLANNSIHWYSTEIQYVRQRFDL